METEKTSDDVRVVPLEESDFAQFRAVVIREYAEGSVAAGRVNAEEAFEWSTRENDRLLPNGARTAGAILLKIVVGNTADPAGYIWVADEHGVGERAFVYDLYLYPDYRGRGYGTAAMRLLEPILRDHGYRFVGLHVYDNNRPAMKLYSKLGYEPQSHVLRKKL